MIRFKFENICLGLLTILFISPAVGSKVRKRGIRRIYDAVCNGAIPKRLRTGSCEGGNTYSFGRTLWHAAVMNGNLGVLSYLSHLGQGGNGLEVGDKDERTPLIFAVMKGQIEMARQLIDLGANIHAHDVVGRQALHYAAEHGHCELAEELLERGAELEAQDNNLVTPLHMAFYCFQWEMFKFLIRRNANINAQDRDGLSILMFAAHQPGGLLMMRDFVLYSQMDYNIVDKHEKTALHHWAMRKRYGNNTSHDGSVIVPCLSKHLDMEAKDKSKMTALHRALAKGNIDFALALIRHGANLDARSKKRLCKIGGGEILDHLSLVYKGRLDAIRGLLNSWDKEFGLYADVQGIVLQFALTEQQKQSLIALPRTSLEQ